MSNSLFGERWQGVNVCSSKTCIKHDSVTKIAKRIWKQLKYVLEKRWVLYSDFRYSYRDSYPSARDDRTESYSRGVSSRGDYMTTRNDPRDSPRDSYPPRSSGDGYASISSRDYREPVSSRGGDRFDRYCVHYFIQQLSWLESC